MGQVIVPVEPVPPIPIDDNLALILSMCGKSIDDHIVDMLDCNP